MDSLALVCLKRIPEVDTIVWRSDEVLYNGEASGSYVFLLRSGLVKLVYYLPDGRYRIVRLLGTGDIAGLERWLGHAYEHTAIAVEPVEACRIPLSALRRLNQEEPTLYQDLLERWDTSLRQADYWITRLSTGNARGRVKSLLEWLAQWEPQGKLKLMRREDMAAMLGLTAETVSREITALRRQQVLVPLADGGFQYTGWTAQPGQHSSGS